MNWEAFGTIAEVVGATGVIARNEFNEDFVAYVDEQFSLVSKQD